MLETCSEIMNDRDWMQQTWQRHSPQSNTRPGDCDSDTKWSPKPAKFQDTQMLPPHNQRGCSLKDSNSQFGGLFSAEMKASFLLKPWCFVFMRNRGRMKASFLLAWNKSWGHVGNCIKPYPVKLISEFLGYSQKYMISLEKHQSC